MIARLRLAACLWRVRFLFMSWWAAKSLTRELESVTRQLRLWEHHPRCLAGRRVSRSDSGPWDLATDISHKSGNHLTNRHSQPPPTRGTTTQSREARGHWGQYSSPDVVWADQPGLGSDSCHLIVSSDARNSNSLAWLSIFPRGPPRPVSRARYCSSLTPTVKSRNRFGRRALTLIPRNTPLGHILLSFLATFSLPTNLQLEVRPGLSISSRGRAGNISFPGKWSAGWMTTNTIEGNYGQHPDKQPAPARPKNKLRTIPSSGWALSEPGNWREISLTDSPSFMMLNQVWKWALDQL